MEVDFYSGMQLIEKQMKNNKRLNHYWDKIIEALKKYCIQNSISYANTEQIFNNIFRSQTINQYFSDGKFLYFLDTNYINHFFKQISVKEFFNIYQIPYIESENTDTIYLYICRIVKNTRSSLAKRSKELLLTGNREPLSFLLYYSLFKYYLSCHQNDLFPIPFILSHPQGFFYVENENLLYFDKQYKQFICLTQESIYKYFELYNFPIPYNKKELQNIFKYIKLLVKDAPLPLSPEQACVMQLKTNQQEYYKYIYDKESKKMQLYYQTNPIRSNNYVPLHTDHTPTLTPNLINYFSELVCNDRHSFITLAKLAAMQYSSNQPSKKIIFIEVTQHEEENLQLFLSSFCQTIISHHSLNTLCETEKLFGYLAHSKLEDYIEHKQPIFFVKEKQLSKLSKHKQKIIKTLISGNTLYYTDSILGTLRYNNYIPIIYLSNNLDDYVLLEKHFGCNILKINPVKMDIPHFTNDEKEWFYRILLPFGREILSNGHHNILRYQPKTNVIPATSIEHFMNSFTVYSDNNYTYPEELYAAYEQFFNHCNPNGQICKKAVFIKLVRGLKGYNYTRIHIRQTKEHPASNRYGFKKLIIDSKKLNDYLSNTDNTSMEHNDLKNELQLITEHYKDLFDSAIPEPPFVPITYNLS